MPGSVAAREQAARPLPERVVGIADVDLDAPLVLRPFDGVEGEPASWSVLAWLHGRPIGLADIRGTPNAQGIADDCWDALRPLIESHLAADGLPGIAGLAAGGLGGAPSAGCRERRAGLHASAPMMSIVIPTRDRAGQIVRCVELLRALDYPDFEIIVVDNSTASDETRIALGPLLAAEPRLHYFAETIPGTSRARNRGAAEARGAYTVFIDDDVWMDRGWLTEIALAFASAPGVGCVNGSILPAQLATPAQLWIEEIGGFNKGFVRREYSIADRAGLGPLFPFSAGMFGSGANMAFRTEAIRSAGGFDTDLGGGTSVSGGEDLSAFIAVLAAGWRLVYEPAAVVRHWHHREVAALRRQMKGYGRGLAAHLLKTGLDRPSLAVDFVRHAAPAVRRLTSGRIANTASAKAARTYPRSLDADWFLGLTEGFIRYAFHRARPRRRSRQDAPPRAVQ